MDQKAADNARQTIDLVARDATDKLRTDMEATFDQFRTETKGKIAIVVEIIKTNKADCDTKGSSANESNKATTTKVQKPTKLSRAGELLIDTVGWATKSGAVPPAESTTTTADAVNVQKFTPTGEQMSQGIAIKKILDKLEKMETGLAALDTKLETMNTTFEGKLEKMDTKLETMDVKQITTEIASVTETMGNIGLTLDKVLEGQQQRLAADSVSREDALMLERL